MRDQIINMRGVVYRVGMRVRFCGGGSEGIGTIREISGRDRLLLDMREDEVTVHGQRWALNPEQAERSGRADYWEPRDHGVSMGCCEPI